MNSIFDLGSLAAALLMAWYAGRCYDQGKKGTALTAVLLCIVNIAGAYL